SEESEAAVSIASTSTYFTVRHDFRRCISPICGGYWVARANKTTTTCADGSKASECYVAEIDWSAAGLTQDDVNDASALSLVLRGTIGSKAYGTIGTFGVFKPTEAWGSTVADAPSGNYYRVQDGGIRCITTPCFSLSADKLNSTIGRTLSSLDGTYGGKALASLPVVATGTIHNTKGGGRALAVTSFWTRIQHSTDPLACTTDSDCTTTPYYKPVTTSGDCYCATCPTTVMNTATADANYTSWNTTCSAKRPTCPMVKCMAPPPVACVSGTCQATKTP
ncbi:MAG: DUF6748 domain-containing protein, partial [Polyangiales bacterium]